MEKKIRFLYAGTGLLICVLFFCLLRAEIAAAAPETDLWWMLPVFSRLTAGKSFFEGLLFLLQPTPRWFELPFLKAYLWFHQALPILQGSYGSLILVSLLLHFFNALLMYAVGQQLGMGRRAGFFSAFTYLTLFVQFHAYYWPSAFQHVLAVFTTLGVLFCYLKTEELFKGRQPQRTLFFFLTLAAGGLGSLQRSTLMLPFMLLAHLVFSSRNAQERVTRFTRWMPFLLLYPLYILLALCFVGDHVYNVGIFKFPLPAGIKALAFFFGGVVGLVALRRLLGISWTMGGRRRIGKALLIFLTVGLTAGLILRDKREILLPYNLITPLTTLLASFLEPIQSALSTDSRVAYYVMPCQISFFFLLLALLSLWVFVRLPWVRPATVATLLMWYGMCTWYLLFHRHVVSSFPLRIPSRYFIYLSPIFSWVFCSSAIALYDLLMKRIRLHGLKREVILVGIFLGLVLPNLMAVRLQLFRGRLVNSYFSYDDVRAGELIQEDLSRLLSETGRAPDRVYVFGAVKMDYPMTRAKYIPMHLIGLDNSRFLIHEKVLSRHPGVTLLVEESVMTDGAGGQVYWVGGPRVRNGQGQWVDPFARHLEEGLQRLDEGDWEGAKEGFQQAVKRRPFLLRYLLSSCRLSDARWLTGGVGLKEWVEEIEGKWRLFSIVPVGKWGHIREVMREELREYGVCLAALSYIEHQTGHRVQGRRWLSQLYFLEPNVRHLREWLEASPQVESRPGLKGYLEILGGARFLEDPLPWQKDDFGFGRFMARLIGAVDIRSEWDREWILA